MKPQEKANELIEKYLSLNDNFNKPIITDEQDAVKCAIVAVDEMIKEFKNSDSLYATKILADYWQSVKTELETLK